MEISLEFILYCGKRFVKVSTSKQLRADVICRKLRGQRFPFVFAAKKN